MSTKILEPPTATTTTTLTRVKHLHPSSLPTNPISCRPTPSTLANLATLASPSSLLSSLHLSISLISLPPPPFTNSHSHRYVVSETHHAFSSPSSTPHTSPPRTRPPPLASELIYVTPRLDLGGNPFGQKSRGVEEPTWSLQRRRLSGRSRGFVLSGSRGVGWSCFFCLFGELGSWFLVRMVSLACPRWDLGQRGVEFGVVSCRRCHVGLAQQKAQPRREGVRCWVSAAHSPDVGAARVVSSTVIREASVLTTISVSDLLETVAGDMRTLNENLKMIVGSENPVLISAAEQIFGAGGKRLRPALVFLVSRATAQIAGLTDLTEQHRRLAEIIEMIHTASLIHDDVLDDSGLRRGKETIHQIYGTRVAVLAGDFMFAQSSWYLANLENLEVIKLISQVIKDFASGEIKQASGLFNCDLSLDEYLLKSYYKTASLVASSTKSAAIFSGVTKNICKEMYEYGKNLGLSFQVVDDILDFTQSSEQLGKPAASDLAKGNLTAPAIFALKKEPKLREIIDSEFSEPGSLDMAIKIINESGGIDRARELSKEKAEVAIQNLQCLPESEYKSALEGMVMFSLQRID